MKIEYLGHSCFRIQTEQGVTIVTDPYTKVGYELPKGLQADIVSVSHGHFDHNYVEAVEGAPMIIETEGEHVVCGVKIVGEHTWHDPHQGVLRGKNIIFKMDIDGFIVCHFGDLGESYSDEIAKILSGTDVWLIPVGGTYTIDAEQAKVYIEKCKPKAVIPMHYLPEDGTLDITGAKGFLQKMNGYPIREVLSESLSLSKEDLEGEQTRIYYMERMK